MQVQRQLRWKRCPSLLAVRMGRYLSGPGHMPVQALVPAYLELLEELSTFAAGMS